MNKPSILKSVSISEMLHLREVDGLSNQEIADKLGVSYVTINRHIGKAPFRKHKGGRKKKEILPFDLPKPFPAGYEPITRVSFKDRCERLLAKTEEHIQEAESMREQVAEHSEADIARAAHMKAVGNPPSASDTKWHPESCAPTIGDIAEEHGIRLPDGAKPTVHKISDYVEELVTVFGGLAVRDYLRCRLYEMGMTHDAVIVDRADILSALKNLDKETVGHD